MLNNKFMLIQHGKNGVWALNCFNGYHPHLDNGQAAEGGARLDIRPDEKTVMAMPSLHHSCCYF